MKKLFMFIFLGCVFTLHAQHLPLPNGIAIPKNFRWQLQSDLSDEFNTDGKGIAFEKQWKDNYMSKWRGPGLTEFTNNHSSVEDGNLVLKVSRKKNTNRVKCGIISSKKTVIFPVYIEARIKPCNQVLSSNLWLLSKDSKRELDMLEIYAGDRPDQKFYARKASHNYHIFIRNAKTNQIEKDLKKPQYYVLPSKEPYRNDFHNFGMFWKSATEMDFYIDGLLVNSLRKEDLEDPDQLYFDRPMHIIFDIEDHDWRSKKGIVATDQELSNKNKNQMFVDWIRVYKPVKE